MTVPLTWVHSHTEACHQAHSAGMKWTFDAKPGTSCTVGKRYGAVPNPQAPGASPEHPYTSPLTLQGCPTLTLAPLSPCSSSPSPGQPIDPAGPAKSRMAHDPPKLCGQGSRTQGLSTAHLLT